MLYISAAKSIFHVFYFPDVTFNLETYIFAFDVFRYGNMTTRYPLNRLKTFHARSENSRVKL